MSKLYDAIDRLEQIAGDEGVKGEETSAPPLPPPQQRSFLLRPLLFAFVLITIGGGIVVGIAWWQDWWFDNLMPSAAEVKVSGAGGPAPLQSPAPQPVHTEQETVETVKDKAGESLPVSIPGDTVMLSEKKDPARSGINIAVPLQEGSPESSGRDRAVGANGGGQRVYPPEPRRVVQSGYVEPVPEVAGKSPVTEEPQPLPAGWKAGTGDDRQQVKETALTRLLLQAEQRRRDQDWQGAVLLYRQVWEESGNPEVANNLAAALLRLHKYEQAIRILEAALAISPDDHDLQGNLNFARRKGGR